MTKEYLVSSQRVANMPRERTLKLQRLALAFAFLAILATPALGQDSANRKEIRRADLSGAPGMEVVLSVSEFKPGEVLARHFHHGIEAGYVLEGAMIQSAGQDARELKTGASLFNLRDAAHGGFTVVGEKTLKLLTVHVVDKGKPLYDVPK